MAAPGSDRGVAFSSNSIAVGTSYVMSIGTGTAACQEDYGRKSWEMLLSDNLPELQAGSEGGLSRLSPHE